MKLSLIYNELMTEGLSDQVPADIERMYGPEGVAKFSRSLGFMPKDKYYHSLRVGSTVAKAGLEKQHVTAAILHDYIERGGDVSKLGDLDVSDHALRIMRLLSVDEKTPGADDNQIVYDHINKMLSDPEIDQPTKDICVVVKCSDRLDNLRKRIRKGALTPEYYGASLKLIDLLMRSFRGDRKPLSHINTKLAQIEEVVESFGFNQPVKGYT